MWLQGPSWADRVWGWESAVDFAVDLASELAVGLAVGLAAAQVVGGAAVVGSSVGTRGQYSKLDFTKRGGE